MDKLSAIPAVDIDGARLSVEGLAAGCLAVLIPVFNEERTVTEILRRVCAQPSVLEVIVVNDGSTDATLERLNECAELYPRLRVIHSSANRGKGASIRAGLLHVSAPLVIIQDADLEYDPADYIHLLPPILRGEADVVYGSRFMGTRRVATGWWHRGGNALLTMVTNGLTGLRLTDEATCYKLFQRGILSRLKLEEDRFGFCPEVTVKAHLLGARFAEVPISYCPRGACEGKKIRFRDGWNALYCLLKYRFWK